MVNDITGSTLDVSQVADAVNRSMVGYSQRQKNQMIREGVQDPSAFVLQNQEFLQQAQQPTNEFLGAGRSSDEPIVYDTTSNFNITGNNNQITSYLDKVRATNPYRDEWVVQDIDGDMGVKYGNQRTNYNIPTTLEGFFNQYGNAPTGGWSDYNTYQGGQNTSLQGWMKDSSLLPNFSLYGTGSAEDINRGYNILQYMSPRNIGEFWSLNPETQRGMLQNPGTALQQMRAYANPANGDWLSVGAEGGFSSLNAYDWDAQRGLTVDPSQYMQVNDDGGGLGGLFGGVYDFMDPILDKVNPLHNWTQDQIVDLGGFDSQKQAFTTIAPIVLAALSAGAASGAAGAGGAAGTSGGVSAGAAAGSGAAGMGGALGSGISAGATGAGLSAGAGLAGAGTAAGIAGTGLTTSQLLTAINALNSASTGDYLGAVTGGLGVAGINPASSLAGQFSSVGVSPFAANMLGSVGASAMSNLARGMDSDKALLSAIFSGASGAGGQALTNFTTPALGATASNILGGAASGGLNSLFNKGDAVAGSLYGGMSGGLHALLNSMGRDLTPQRSNDNKTTAKNITKIVQTLARK